MKISFLNRRWYDWILIIAGTLNIGLDVLGPLFEHPQPFSWIRLVAGLIMLWLGTVPREQR